VSDVDSLRQQLRERGYLTHGIERWFALDPWSSRTFWVELLLVAVKAAVLIAIFGALPLTAIMLFRDAPLHALETLALFATYGVAWFVVAFALVVLTALILKKRPSLPIDTPRALLAISVAAGALLVAPIAIWWYRFETQPGLQELGVGVALSVVFFLVVIVVLSAALLSFSIYEVRRIPAIHQKPRTVPIAIAALALVGLLFVPALVEKDRTTLEPMVVTMPTSTRVALIAVDGLTHEILQSRPDLLRALPQVRKATTIASDSTAERWASLGTGVRTEDHGVRALEGIRFAGGQHVLQRVSHADFVLTELAPLLRIARREPLPPTVRRREYIWEIFAKRGVTSASINWWATEDDSSAGLLSIGPESVFTAGKGDPLRVDAVAVQRFTQTIDEHAPRFATVYLPALDVVLNRITLDPATRLATSLRALDGIAPAIAHARARGYEVLLAGMPGDGQSGTAVIASTLAFQGTSAWDVAPTLLETIGFPPSEEMPGKAGSPQVRITSYGPRQTQNEASPVNEEYYENLKSLGYIQ
jgi:hypothetical protein